MMLDTEDKLDAMRDHLAGYGAWEREEIDSWDGDKLESMLIQEIAAKLREAGFNDPDSFDAAEMNRQLEAGRVSGCLYPGEDGRVYFHLGA